MASHRDVPPAFLLVALLAGPLLWSGCERPTPAVEEEPAAARGDTGRAIERADPELTAACDSVGEWLRTSMGRDVQATYGRFTGSLRGAARYGCRLAATDTLPADAPQRPLDRVWQMLAMQGWSVEPAYGAEGPEGRMSGMRRESTLCVLQHYWEVGSDDDRAEQWVTPSRYDVVIECFREAQRNGGA